MFSNACDKKQFLYLQQRRFFPYFMNSISILIRIKTLVRIVKKNQKHILGK